MQIFFPNPAHNLIYIDFIWSEVESVPPGKLSGANMAETEHERIYGTMAVNKGVTVEHQYYYGNNGNDTLHIDNISPVTQPLVKC